MKKPKREQRKSGDKRRRGEIQPRDLLVLRAIGLAGAMSTSQIRVYADMSEHVAPRRLRFLRDAGLVHVDVIAMSQANRYRLTHKGREACERVFGTTPGLRCLRAPPRGLVHHDLVVDTWVHLTVAAARSKSIVLEQFLFEAHVRERVGSPAGAQLPDAVFTLESTEGTHLGAFAIEADTGSETPRWVNAHKFVPYAEIARSGGGLLGHRAFRVLFVTPNVRRRNRLALSAWESGAPEGLFYFAATGDLVPSTVLTKGWFTPRSDAEQGAVLAPESPFPATTLVSAVNAPNEIGEKPYGSDVLGARAHPDGLEGCSDTRLDTLRAASATSSGGGR